MFQVLHKGVTQRGMDALSLSSNIVRRGAVYYIRVRVPSDLLDYYAPKKEITYSLKTKDPREAKRKGNLP